MTMTPTTGRLRRVSRTPEVVGLVLATAETLIRAELQHGLRVVQVPTERVASRIEVTLPVIQSVLRAELDELGRRLSASVEYVCAPQQQRPRHKPYVRVTPHGIAAPRINEVVGVSLPTTRAGRAEVRTKREAARETEREYEDVVIDPDFDELDEDLW